MICDFSALSATIYWLKIRLFSACSTLVSAASRALLLRGMIGTGPGLTGGMKGTSDSES